MKPWVIFAPEGINHTDAAVQAVLRALPGPSGVLLIPQNVDFSSSLGVYEQGWQGAVAALRDPKAFVRWQQRLAQDDQFVWPSLASREHLALYLESEAERRGR